jgi:hypothetical protein
MNLPYSSNITNTNEDRIGEATKGSKMGPHWKRGDKTDYSKTSLGSVWTLWTNTRRISSGKLPVLAI